MNKLRKQIDRILETLVFFDDEYLESLQKELEKSSVLELQNVLDVLESAANTQAKLLSQAIWSDKMMLEKLKNSAFNITESKKSTTRKLRIETNYLKEVVTK